MDHKRLVLLGTAGYELVREEIDEKPVNVEKAFRQHHYEWATDGDPFKDQFRRWIPDAPDLSQGAHALLKARHKALQDEEKTILKNSVSNWHSWASLYGTKAHANIGEKQKPIPRKFSSAKDCNNRGSRKSLFFITAQ